MSSKNTHLNSSDLAFADWSLMMLVHGQRRLCCFVARLHSNACINSSHMQTATQQTRLDFLLPL